MSRNYKFHNLEGYNYKNKILSSRKVHPAAQSLPTLCKNYKAQIPAARSLPTLSNNL
ncbi:MAG: hypothetical protein RSA74_10575 [Chryseobacterium sp.]